MPKTPNTNLISNSFWIHFQIETKNATPASPSINNKKVKNTKHHKNNNVNSNEKDIKNPYLYSQLKNVFNEHQQYIHCDRQLRKNVKNQCKHAVYKFMKGLLKRKLKNSDEDLYVEVIMLISLVPVHAHSAKRRYEKSEAPAKIITTIYTNK